MPFTVKLHNYTTLTFNESSSEISYNASLQSLVTYSKKNLYVFDIRMGWKLCFANCNCEGQCKSPFHVERVTMNIFQWSLKRPSSSPSHVFFSWLVCESLTSHLNLRRVTVLDWLRKGASMLAKRIPHKGAANGFSCCCKWIIWEEPSLCLVWERRKRMDWLQRWW